MRVAVTSTLSSLDAPVGAELRHSRYLLIVDIHSMDYKVMINPVMVVNGPAMWKLFIQELWQLPLIYNDTYKLPIQESSQVLPIQNQGVN